MKDGSLNPVQTDAAPRLPAALSVSASHSPQTAGAMSGDILQRRVTIVNPQGFHMRPQSLFVQLANQFASTVALCRGDQRVNGKSQWEVLLLSAEPGTELLLEVSGPDAPAALEALAGVLAAPHVDEPPETALPPKG